jgi:DNA-binding MarR family transcriptional regulator
METRVALPTLLSQTLVAFVVEFDNEFEHRVPHRTSNYGASDATAPRNVPWLVSMAMWATFLRFVPDEGITFGELTRRTGGNVKEMRQWLERLSQWWRYLEIHPATGHPSGKAATRDMVVRPTAGGQKALQVWRVLTDVIEERWAKRFGEKNVSELRKALRALIDKFGFEPAASMPILGYGLYTKRAEGERPQTSTREQFDDTLPALLSKVLLAFALDFERESQVSLAISANVLRLIDADGIRVRDLPRLAGVSKEAVATALSYLSKRGYAELEREASRSGAKVVLLTTQGQRARDEYARLLSTIETRWSEQFGSDALAEVRRCLERIAKAPGNADSPLLAGLKPYPTNWRAKVAPIEHLPHFPMTLHRGGYPDGS